MTSSHFRTEHEETKAIKSEWILNYIQYKIKICWQEVKNREHCDWVNMMGSSKKEERLNNKNQCMNWCVQSWPSITSDYYHFVFYIIKWIALSMCIFMIRNISAGMNISVVKRLFWYLKVEQLLLFIIDIDLWKYCKNDRKQWIYAYMQVKITSTTFWSQYLSVHDKRYSR